MNAIFQELGRKLAEQWVTLLVLPGLLLLATAAVGVTLGHTDPFDVATLLNKAADKTAALQRGGAVAVALATVGLLLLSSGLGYAARLTGSVVQRVWLGQAPWPPPLVRRLARARLQRWDEAASHVTAAVDANQTPANIQAAIDQRNTIALYPPTQATWMGDRFVAAAERIWESYRLDLSSTWPRLWLLAPAETRNEVRTAYTAFQSAAMLGGWGTLYILLGILWWPGTIVGATVIISAWLSGRSALSTFAELVEALVDLYLPELADRLRVPTSAGRITHDVGSQLTEIFRKGT